MKTNKLIILLAILITGYSASAEDSEKTVLLANFEAINGETLARVQKFVQEQLGIRIRATTLKQNSIPEKTFKPATFTAFKKDKDLMMIALVATTNKMPVTTLLSTNDMLAVVNLSEMKSPDAEIFPRRVERLVMRSIAFLSGLTPSPDPFCVTKEYKSLDELDKMGRNFCPLWKSRFDIYAQEKTLKIQGEEINTSY